LAEVYEALIQTNVVQSTGQTQERISAIWYYKPETGKPLAIWISLRSGQGFVNRPGKDLRTDRVVNVDLI